MENTVSFQDTSSERWKVSRYTLLAYLYFFFNSVLLPKGLLYTNILSPVFYFNTIRRGYNVWWWQFAASLLVFDGIHLYYGVDLPSFIVSNGLFISTYMCVVAFYHFIDRYHHTGRLMRNLLLFNAALTCVALIFLMGSRPLQDLFWYVKKFTSGVEDMPRLALFTYEASYYSLLLVPVAYYYFVKYALAQFSSGGESALILAVIPLMLSLSFGVIGATAISIIIYAVLNIRPIFRRRRSLRLFSICAGLLVIAVALIWLIPGNPLLVRINNVLSGDDSSANGRTFDSFRMAWLIAREKNEWFGCGLGQVKVLTQEIVRTHFQYWGNFPRYDIPNAMGETLAIFGITGVIVRLGLQVWLFLRTRVYDNHYRMLLFLFMFIYQFTGSFITNIVEYVIWCIAFSSAFTRFNVTPRGPDTSNT
jgi:hypothetical protein